MSPTLELFQYSPKHGLPSSDPFCLSAQLYLRFVGLKFEKNSCDNTKGSPTGVLPMLRYDDEIVAGMSRIVTFLSDKDYCLDHNLSSVEISETEAFTALVENKLYNLMLYNFWMIEENAEFCRLQQAYSLSFPLSFILPSQTKKENIARLHSLGFSDKDKDWVYNEIGKCYEALETRLGENKFFFGNSPKSLDAVVAGHLLVHQHVPLPCNPLAQLLHQFPKLVLYCHQMRGWLGGQVVASGDHGARPSRPTYSVESPPVPVARTQTYSIFGFSAFIVACVLLAKSGLGKGGEKKVEQQPE